MSPCDVAACAEACVSGVAGYRLTAPLGDQRLVLRAYREDDFDAVFAMRSSPEVARYLYWEPQTESEVRRTLAFKVESVSLEAQGDVLALAAEHRESGALVGDVILVGSASSTVWARSATSPSRPRWARLCDGDGPAAAGRRVRRRGPPSRDRGRPGRDTASVRVLEKLGMRREAHFVENEFVKGEWQSEARLRDPRGGMASAALTSS